MTGVSMGVEQLERVPSIQYPVQFKGHTTVQALLDSGSEVNVMTSAYVAVLGLRVCSTDVWAQKIDGSMLSTHGMVLATFQLEDKYGRTQFFQETFLVADTAIEVVLGMPFLALSKANVKWLNLVTRQDTRLRGRDAQREWIS